MKSFHWYLVILILISSCSVQRRIGRMADKQLFKDPVLGQAHTGISIYNPSSGKYLYNYNADKYFVPASNVKIFTTYVGMKLLGDSLNGIGYQESDTALFVFPTGDPTLLHTDYKRQPVAQFLRASQKPVYIIDTAWKDNAFGYGWSWDDYNYYYMPERSALPVYGNVVTWVQEKSGETPSDSTVFDQSVSIYSIPEVNWNVRFRPEENAKTFFVERSKDKNEFLITQGSENLKKQEVPFITNGLESAIELLKDTIGKTLLVGGDRPQSSNLNSQIIHSQPIDSMLAPMMHRSDNFFAEQTLLMASQILLGKMATAAIIDTVLKTDLRNLPSQPRWVDGSGLSHNNLFTPNAFIAILDTLQREFGLDRIRRIFPNGGEGTLKNYYTSLTDQFIAKTGTLSGVVALSGYMYTKKKQLLMFSVLVNNHRGSSASIRRRVEAFLMNVHERN